MEGKEALEYFERLRQQGEETAAQMLAKAKLEAAVRGKEPFDLAKLEQLCDTSSEGRLDPVETRHRRFEYMYYVDHPSLMTIADFAAWVESSTKG